MKAKEAYRISVENLNIIEYVEKSISKGVEDAAKCGSFNAVVKVSYFNGMPKSLKETFVEKVKDAAQKLGYKVELTESFEFEMLMRLSWKLEE